MRTCLLAAPIIVLIMSLAACGNSEGGGGSNGGANTNTAPVAANDGAATPMNTVVDINVLANDVDADGDPLAITNVSTPGSGSATDLGNGLIRYTPTGGFVGGDTFTYTISDGNGGTDTASVTVTVTWVNSPPVAQNDSAATPVNLPVDINALANDTDPDGDTLTVTSVATPAGGTATILGNGQVRYAPGTGFSGADSFDYIIDDGNGGTDTGTVNVVVSIPSWTVANTSTVVSGVGAQAAAIADYNGDGKPDLAFATPRTIPSTYMVHLNTTATAGSAPTFTAGNSYTTGLMTDIVAADVNSDGLPDLLAPAALASGADLRVQLNDAANPGSFLAEQTFSAASGTVVTQDIATGDLDGDGDLDVVIALRGGISVSANNTAAGSTTAAFSLVSIYAAWTGAVAAGSGLSPLGVALADINDDGKLDLINGTPDNGGEVWVRLNTSSSGSISFGSPAVFTATGVPDQIVCGDIDGDGRPDIALTDQSSSSVLVLLNQTTAGASSVSLASAVTLSVINVASGLILADLTGDGRLDIACCGNGSVVVLLNFSTPGTATFASAVSYSAAWAIRLSAADVNGDGILDLVVPDDDASQGVSNNKVLTGQ
jgi:hypothetical protein